LLALTQTYRHAGLVTAIFAGPEMIDYALTHVPSFYRGNQYVVAFSAHHSVGRAIVIPCKGHGAFPVFLGLMAHELKKNITTCAAILYKLCS
jgi:hypothetical protein